jgi:hypothetical protein
VVAANVIEQRLEAHSCVLIPVGGVEERSETDAHIPDSSGDVKECILAHRGVLVKADPGRIWATCFQRRRKRKPAERNCHCKKAATQWRAVNGSYQSFHFFVFP